MTPQSKPDHSEPVLVRVSPEILERMKTGDVEPVVILGVQELGDGTYDMTLKTPDHAVKCRRLRALLREAIPWLDHEPDEGRELARRIELALDERQGERDG